MSSLCPAAAALPSQKGVQASPPQAHCSQQEQPNTKPHHKAACHKTPLPTHISRLTHLFHFAALLQSCYRYIEVGRGALATPIEGRQYGELLPNATGNYCQDIKLQKGAQYKLSYYYGRLMTFKKG